MPERIWSLAYLTAAPLTPPEAITLAAELGYDAVGLRALPAAPGGEASPLIEDRALLAETRRRAASTGIVVFDMEIVRIGPGFTRESIEPFLGVCGALSAQAVLVAGDDPDEARLTASFAMFCEAAASYGLTADLEFMPWTAVRDCRTARRIVEAAGQPNGRVLVDALHVARSTTGLDDLSALPRGMMSYAQICDAPAGIPPTVDGLIHTARQERLLPGDGGIPLRDIFRALPADLPISIEIPNVAAKAENGVRKWADMALQRARQVVVAPAD